MDLENENRRLRRQLQELTDEARNSEAVARRCHDRELQILTAETLPELLNILTEGMQRSFGMSSLSLVLADPDHEIQHLLRHAGTPAEAFAMVRFEEDLEWVLSQDPRSASSPFAWNVYMQRDAEEMLARVDSIFVPQR